jgi:hypothetical protein
VGAPNGNQTGVVTAVIAAPVIHQRKRVWPLDTTTLFSWVRVASGAFDIRHATVSMADGRRLGRA